MKSSKYLKTFLRIGISLVLIIILIKTQDVLKIKLALFSFKFLYLLIAFVLLLIGTFVSSLRWKEILATSDSNISVKYLFVLYLKGYFYNNFLPTQMGGDVYKSISLGSKIKNQPLALFSVFMDRFSGLVVLLVLTLFGVGSVMGQSGFLLAIVVFIMGLILYYPVLGVVAKKIKFFQNFKKGSDLFLKDKKRGLLVLCYSLLVQVFSFSIPVVLFWGFNIALPLKSIIAFLPIASLSLLVPSFNGFGTQETVYAYLFSNVGVTSEVSIAVSLLIHSVRILMSLLGWVFILLNINTVFEKHKKAKL
ncbi:hypothetical protein COV24_01950 [candidate division WWE3 bacterium CG10_big_fil_rev_8_21_14_0_10_32_10]|uniref:TIGR00374 family protein n=1 Tax=candidate division WWE3 bacterium CG10_big_fil_rev_8_21_14_0_10_32_10 TaxID=1975090 RepID=A0A2H0RCL9_UNCKA|nr:MAG: hypothetical protein COV24_01950 [candidate division WWE3 bacterium CG10_big_fil_rev_8_21_14_0_10_32_10]